MWKKLRRLLRGLALMAGAITPHAALAQDSASAITTRDLATLRDIGGLSVSPNGRWAAVAVTRADPSRNQYDSAWYAVNIATRQQYRVADAGELVPARSRNTIFEYKPPQTAIWSPDSAWIIYLRTDNGRTQIWRARRNGGRARQLTHNIGDVRALAYARDADKILFQTEPSQVQMAMALAEEGRTGFRYDDRFTPLSSLRPSIPDDINYERPFELQTAGQIAAQQVWAYDVSSGRERLATEAEREEFTALTTPPYPRRPYSGDSAVSPQGGVAWTEARDPQRQGIFPPMTVVAQLPGAPGPIVCTAATCTADRLDGLWWRNDRELLFVRLEGPRLQDRRLYAWRPGSEEPPRLILHASDRFGRTDGCAVANDQLLCFYEQPSRPRRLVTIDLESGALETLFEPNPDFARFDLGQPPQRLVIRATSGVETYGYLALPPSHREGERLPLVIVTYRCDGFLRGGVGDEYPVFPLAVQGFAVLCFDLPQDHDQMARLDAASHVYWERGPGAPMRHRIEDALEAAVAQLDRMGVIDPDRVGVTGLSYGTEIVGFALPHMPRLAVAISAGGPGPGPSLYPFIGRFQRRVWQAYGLGSPARTPERWRELSFSPFVEFVRAPLLINVADREFLAALDAVTALEDAGRAVEMFVFPEEYHVKWQPAHRLAIYNRNIDWLNYWLRGAESNLSEAPEQYVRWRAMRENQCRLFGPGGTQRHVRPLGGAHLPVEELIPWYCRPEP